MAIQLDDLVARLRLDTSGVGTGLSGLNSSLGSVGDKASAAGRKLTLGVTTPLVGIGIASTNLAANFDKTMRQVAVATGGPTEALSKLATQMGAETAFSAGEAADAMLELAKGGMTAAQIQGGALAATMKLASAGGVDLASASTYVANSLATYGLNAKDADKVTVALAGAANASSASVESLGQGLAQGALAARNAGLSLQETTGVLSLFDAAGLKGSDAGTSLKSALNSLIPTTDKAKAAMEDAGLSFVDAEGNFDSVATVAEKLRKGLGPLSEAQRSQALETIFGSDGMRAATVLMNGGREAVEKYTKASRDQETTTKLANAAMEGTSGAMERASGSIETAGLKLGQVLAPYIEQAAGKAEELANRFTELDPATQGTIVKVAALTAVVGPATLAVGVLASSLSNIIGVTSSVRTGLSTFATTMGDAEKRTVALGTAAKRAAGTGGMIALTVGLSDAAREGNNTTNVLSSMAGGAGIGAMFGPIGALVGAAGGGGLALLAGSLHKTAEESEAARLELIKSEGFANAKAGADKLSEALNGVVSSYGKIPRAAVEASFTGEDGKLQADIQLLRDMGVSLDTIVSATLGQRDAQKLVDQAFQESYGNQRKVVAAAKEEYKAAKAAADALVDDTAQASLPGYTKKLTDAGTKVRELKEAWQEAKGPIAETAAVQKVFNERVGRGTAEVEAHRKEVRQLADDLGLSVQQYRQFPREVRTRIEAAGLPETIADTLLLIKSNKDLQSFRNIKTLIEATNAPLSTKQIETLTERYKLTPKQVKTLIEAVGVESEAGKVRGYKGDLDKIPPRVSTEVHTSYTYSGLKSPTRGSGGGAGDYSPKATSRNEDAARSSGFDVGTALGEGIGAGVLGRTAATSGDVDKSVDDAGKKARPNAKRVGEFLGNNLADGIAGTTERVRAQMSKLMELVEKTHNDRAIKLAASAAAALQPLAREYTKLKEQLAAATKGLEKYQAAREAVEFRQASLSAAGGDLTSLVFGEDDEGMAIPPTADAIIAGLEQVNAAATQFDSNLVALRDAGLSQDALDQLIAKGPEAAAAMAQAILAGGPEAIARINDLQNNIAAVGISIQGKASQTMYDAGVAAQQGLISGLDSQMEVLEDQMNKIAKVLVRALRKALKIKSPSRVMAGLGEFTGEGFAQGLASTEEAVRRASLSMAGAAQTAVPTFADPNVVSLAARRASAAVTGAGSVAPTVRVFIGDRELTDIVRVELGDAVAPLATAVRQGV